MTICRRCGWLIPTDCTCRGQTDQLSAVRLKDLVEKRHRESVARAYESGWAVRSVPAEQTGGAAA